MLSFGLIHFRDISNFKMKEIGLNMLWFGLIQMIGNKEHINSIY